jgi:hypothetical protein
MSAQDVQNFFNTYVYGFMCHDIEEAIKAKTNFLVALGLSVYTEVMGGLVTGRLKDMRWSRKNYKAFLHYMGRCYIDIDNQIDLYRKVRCGLTHEYFVKVPSTIYVECVPSSAPGIVYDGGILKFAVKNYYRDFRKGCDAYLNELVSRNRPDLLQNFYRAVNQ